MKRCLSFFLLLVGLGTTALPARAQQDGLLPVEEAFQLEARAVAADRIDLEWRIADDYYLYRSRIKVRSTTPGATLGALELPAGVKKHDEFLGEMEVYHGRIVATQAISVAAGTDTVELGVSVQGCHEVEPKICYPPYARTLRVSLPATGAANMAIGSATPSASGSLAAALGRPANGLAATPGMVGTPLPDTEAFRVEAIAGSPTSLLLRFTPAPGYYLYRDKLALRVPKEAGIALGTPAWPAGRTFPDPHFGEVPVYFDLTEVPVPLARTRGEETTLALEVDLQGCQTDGICYPPMTRHIDVMLPAATPDQLVQAAPAATATDTGRLGLALALLLAIGGGLILNLMPCVLPVLSLKALGLAQGGESPAKARAHAIWYTAGVLVTFAAVGLAALGLRAAGQALGWGFQLQQPLVVAALTYVIFAIGLNLSGAFTIGGQFAGIGQSLAVRSGPVGDFFTGALAVVVASPCTAPFMGTALAYAFAAPPVLALLVFLALGLGLALPFLLIGFVPALAARLPRPGAWMETFRQALAFPMYLTAVWLLWVLARQRGTDAAALLLGGAVLLALGLWWLERLRGTRRPVARALAALTLAVALLPLAAVQRLSIPAAASESADGAVPYSVEKLAVLRREGHVVFVNMTADWCVTCKANEKRVFGTEAFRQALTAVDAVYMKGDWTNVDPAITRFLEAHDAVGVPLYVVFPPGEGKETVLPTVPSLDTIETALRQAHGG